MIKRLWITTLLSSLLLLFVILFPNLEALPMEHPLEAAPQEKVNLSSVYEEIFVTNQNVAAYRSQRESGEIAGFNDLLSETSQPKEDPSDNQPQVLGTITLIGPPLPEEPVDRNAGIMIPAIGVNSPIAYDVSVADKDAYMEALEVGVAHAAGTGKPADDGNPNTYLFAHSTADEADIARYAAMFTKLDELQTGDRVSLFYNGKRYDYEMSKGEVVEKFDTTVLTKQYDHTTLTMQTCHPRGVAENRYIVTSTLIGIYDR